MNIRSYCLEALIKVDKDKAFSNLVVKEYLDKYSFSSEDKGYFTNVVYGVITHKKYLNFLLSKYVKRPHKQQYWLKNLLMMSTYEIYFLSTPHFAITSEAVNIAKKRGGGAKGSFVNGVLRSIIRDKGKVIIPTDDNIKYLSLKYSLEEWMIEEFEGIFTDSTELEEFCASLNNKLPLTLRVNTLKTTKEELTQTLTKMGVEANDSPFVKDAVVLQKHVPVKTLKPLLDEGLCVVQDQGSILVAEILDPRPDPDERVLDMCAAPGGKSTHMAQLMDNKGMITSCDIHEHKLKLIEDLALRLGVSNIEAKKIDGTHAQEIFEKEYFDKILLDAPCSGLGVITNKPDIKWNKSIEDISEIAKIQKKLINNAATLLKPNGVLVYSTCTVTKQENEDIIASFLKENDKFRLDTQRRLYPHRNNCHGFYIAKLIREGE
ncbi:16S rRNA (cytosine(967)-C(5))-methyltransferase RsmB [Alkalicella caledoniensis]|uniref:16S rRNA (cytosine(967)-C(5))-methyltransferase n=1 Tax=Alkalicella caledoniensis TaxID=2731377 RepID=A0A7G9WCD4_ALKCA|nr:16S rRNA (cytosine(967)-C(5))-methyltransferase RsmB [Alkalicella caledoniensis]QNO16346.1 16S rRNA (cytosine(967)-C(5))-methyltransferase RsmB [Alkalicella caledoniensis]